VLDPVDRSRYTRIAALAAPVVERALSDRVVANRVARATVDPPALALRPWRGERRLFALRLRRLAHEHRTLLFADVAACYPSISAAVARRALEELGAPGGAELEAFLRDLRGIRGLPVGPTPSALFANAVLSSVDRALEGSAIAHLRWVDDLVLGLASPADAEPARRLLRRALEPLGLRPNEAKTRVVVDPTVLSLAPSGSAIGEAVG
jgi:hypothetical protein